MKEGALRFGIGGWDYDPWRETFYPPGLPKGRQLEYAGGHLQAIEINATYYKLQKPELFERWAKAVPDGFKFAIKGSRYCSNRKLLGEGGEGIERFCGQGLIELGDKLGPILWQLMATKKFEAADFRAFLDLLPRSVGGVPLSHVVEPRHESFRTPEFVAMTRERGVGIVYADAADRPCIADVSGDIVYARLQNTSSDEPAGYPGPDLDRWSALAKAWARGESPQGLPCTAPPASVQPRDTYVFVIGGAKERNPAAAVALIERTATTG
jgi:uncharacterized protein YecE (DUF72 family)